MFKGNASKSNLIVLSSLQIPNSEQIFGLWRLNIFTEDSNLKYEIAPLHQSPPPMSSKKKGEAELQAMYMFIIIMIFMSLALLSLFIMMQQPGLVEAGGSGGRSLLTSSRRGLLREVIDSLPLKWYKAPSHSAMGEGGDIESKVHWWGMAQPLGWGPVGGCWTLGEQ